jgi:hypothetical protein
MALTARGHALSWTLGLGGAAAVLLGVVLLARKHAAVSASTGTGGDAGATPGYSETVINANTYSTTTSTGTGAATPAAAGSSAPGSAQLTPVPPSVVRTPALPAPAPTRAPILAPHPAAAIPTAPPSVASAARLGGATAAAAAFHPSITAPRLTPAQARPPGRGLRPQLSAPQTYPAPVRTVASAARLGGATAATAAFHRPVPVVYRAPTTVVPRGYRPQFSAPYAPPRVPVATVRGFRRPF